MKRVWSITAVVGSVTIAASTALMTMRSAPTSPSPSVSPLSSDIALFERRAAQDPLSAADRAQLSMLYLQRGRETGEYGDFQRAERAARSALGIRTDRNRKAMLGLASSLLAQHRFVEARATAEQLLAADPEQMGSRALLAEILLELGAYPAADSQYRILTAHAENLAVAPRLARWHELHGRDRIARALLIRSATTADGRTDLPREQVAWFHLRVADHALRNGRPAEAERAINAGLRARPQDHRLISLRARIAAERGDWRKALADVRAVGEAADLATLALGGDAARRLGDADLAQRYYSQVERNAREKPEPFARQWTQYCLEHGRHLAETVATLEQEIRIRRDVLGYQLLAWAYHLSGRRAEARAAILHALAPGSRDARLHALAHDILRASGDTVLGRKQLRALP